jgi:hypothetical protein
MNQRTPATEAMVQKDMNIKTPTIQRKGVL